jgi:hypothetical protein
MGATRDSTAHSGRPGSGWRPLKEEDLAVVSHIAAALHPDFPERPEVFSEKFRLFPAGCLSMELCGNMVGYAIAHPWVLDEIPPLDAFLGSLPIKPECIFLHDVAILAQGRGRGASVALIDILAAIAHRNGVESLALVSLYGAQIHWTKFGFMSKTSDDLSKRLRAYGRSAVYMVKKL